MFDNISQQVREGAERLAGSAVSAAKYVGEKVSFAIQIGKCRAEILAEKESIRRAHTAIGELYVKQFGDAPHERMMPEIDKLSASRARITQLEHEIEIIKSEAAESGEKFTDADFEDYGDE